MSNFCNFGITSREELKTYILHFLGYPLVQVELTDEQLDFAIDQAIEYFTKYADQDEEYLALPLDEYVENEGLLLPDNVTGVFALDSQFDTVGKNQPHNSLFTLDAQMKNMMYDMGIWSGGMRGGFIGWHLMHERIELFKRLLGQRFTFNWNVRTKYLKLIPDPSKLKITGYAIIGCNTIRAETYQYGEDLVKRLALAHSKIILGQVRKKFSGVQLLGGGTIDASVYDEGVKERDEILVALRDTEGPVNCFIVG